MQDKLLAFSAKVAKRSLLVRHSACSNTRRCRRLCTPRKPCSTIVEDTIEGGCCLSSAIAAFKAFEALSKVELENLRTRTTCVETDDVPTTHPSIIALAPSIEDAPFTVPTSPSTGAVVSLLSPTAFAAAPVDPSFVLGNDWPDVMTVLRADVCTTDAAVAVITASERQAAWYIVHSTSSAACHRTSSHATEHDVKRESNGNTEAFWNRDKHRAVRSTSTNNCDWSHSLSLICFQGSTRALQTAVSETLCADAVTYIWRCRPSSVELLVRGVTHDRTHLFGVHAEI